MPHGPEHHIEHAEHAAHASHSEFAKRVTISIAIIAAAVACVTMLGHRTHTETLQLQTLAAHKATEATDQWNYYQTKNTFHHLSELMLDQLKVFQMDASAKDLQKMCEKHNGIVEYYAAKKNEKKAEAEALAKESEGFLEEAHKSHARTYYFDYGEVVLQLGLVLCSLAILTKSHRLWFTGIFCAAIGAVIALIGVLSTGMAMH
jgi:Domain of unknown function (DUF4337)